MNVYIVRYEDADIEYCNFYCNQRDAYKGRAELRRKFKKFKSGSVEKINVGRKKEGFINLFHKYGIKSRLRD